MPVSVVAHTASSVMASHTLGSAVAKTLVMATPVNRSPRRIQVPISPPCHEA